MRGSLNTLITRAVGRITGNGQGAADQTMEGVPMPQIGVLQLPGISVNYGSMDMLLLSLNGNTSRRIGIPMAGETGVVADAMSLVLYSPDGQHSLTISDAGIAINTTSLTLNGRQVIVEGDVDSDGDTMQSTT